MSDAPAQGFRNLRKAEGEGTSEPYAIPSCGASETPPLGMASEEKRQPQRPTLRASSCRKEPGND
jgi:hypothetical protein